MAAQTYTADIIVLKKTKLGESDLILTCLASDGQQVRFVAKGARKPGGSFASRLELFSCAHVLLVKGRNLDIVKEARLINGYSALRHAIEKSTAAAPMAEFLARVTQDGLEAPRLYEMTNAALAAIERCEVGQEAAYLAAYLVKAFVFCGVAPSLNACVSCGAPADAGLPGIRLSFEEGGVVCQDCRVHVPSIEVPTELIRWIDVLLHARFSDIEDLEVTDEVSYEVLRFCQSWSRTHVGTSMKSLDFMMTMALPSL